MDNEDGFRTTPPPPAPGQNPLLSFARANVALLVPVVAALIFVIRCVAVARGDGLTAYSLIATTTIGDAIRALAFFIIELGLVLNALVLIIVVGRRAKLDLTNAGLAAASLASFIAATYLPGPPSWDDVGILIAIALANLIRGFAGDGRIDLRSLALFAIFAAVIIFASLSIVDDTFWLPRERLVFQNEAPFTGYVLKESGDYLVILKDKPRVIIERKKETLDDRDFCHPGPTDEEPISEKVQSNTPVCP
jgi:hypothetical protein